MAMTLMQEFFYGASERAYFVHYGRQASFPKSRTRRPMNFIAFDLMVQMCCKKCEDDVRDALLDLSSVQEVKCYPYHQRVHVAGYLDPAQALQQVKRVKNSAKLWSEFSSHTYEVSSCQTPQYFLQHDSSSIALSDTREKRTSYPDRYNSSRNGRYFWTSSPGYRNSAITHVVSINPTTATRMEIIC